jgi:hypothetical protein
MPSRPRAQADPEPDPIPPLDTGSTHLYRVLPADGSAQLLIEWDGGHMVQAGTVLHAPVMTGIHAACGGLLNLVLIVYGSQEQQAEAAGRGKQGVSN